MTSLTTTPLPYRTSGSGEPLVLVHANLSDVRAWTSLEPLLADRFQVISYSRRFAHPHPPIAPDADDQLQVHAEDLVDLIEAHGRGPVHLVGNSSGAFVCLLVADRRPDLVRTLSLEEPPVVSMFVRTLPPRPVDLLSLLATDPGALVAFLKFGAGAMGPSVKAFRQGDDERGLDAFGRGILGAKTYARVSAARRRQMQDNLAPHRAALLGAGLPTFTAEQARALTVPTQLIRGVHTAHFQRRISQRLAALVPGAREVVVDDASHFVHEDNPRAVAEAVRQFVHDLSCV